ncbi:MAG: hypothetical protein QM755_14520 [Luteolibacter sp.]
MNLHHIGDKPRALASEVTQPDFTAPDDSFTVTRNTACLPDNNP